MNHSRPLLRFSVIALGFLIAVFPLQAATFSGNARVEINDPTGTLSWSNSVNALTVSCWFKVSIPSGQAISENMTILVNRRTGTEVDNCAYLIRFNAVNGSVEFLSQSSSGSYLNTLIQTPYLDRWYHVAVVRSGSSITSYVDGREVAPGSGTIGNANTTDGVSIGGWGSVGTGNYFYGEIQEVAIYQAALSQEFITQYMYQDQPALNELTGYYKLASATNSASQLKNLALTPPTGTDPATAVGNLTFEAVDEAGEQSAFDAKKNGGSESIVPLSGSFSWEQTALARPTPGIAFDFRFGYSSANAFNGFLLGGFDPFASSTIGKGWRHTFETRVLPSQYFSPVAGSDTIGLMSWDGAIDTWDFDYDNYAYKTRDKEYRGELNIINNYCEWTTPERLIYRFRDPNAGANILMRGRLMQIRDFNGNSVNLAWNQTIGVLTQVVDSAGGKYDFRYNAQHLLTNVTFQGWSVNFGYDDQNRLTNKFVTAPAAYTNLNTRWSFSYNSTSGLLERIIDPRGNTNTYVLYDTYGRVGEERDALNRSKKTEYGVPGTRQVRHTDPEGFQWLETYDRKGHLVSQADPLNNTTSYAYDDFGNRVSITEPLGWKTSFSYDDRANVLTKTNAFGQVSTWTYHTLFNKPLTATDPLNWVTHYDYDGAGNLLHQYDNLGDLVRYAYLTNGLVQTATDGNGNVTRFAYNSDGFMASRTDAANNVTSFTRNEVGWLLAETNPLNQISTFGYDINGHVVQRVDPLLRTYTSVFDPNGNLTAQSDAKAQFTYQFYDAANQRTGTVDRVGIRWRYSYTSRGEVAAITDPLGNVVSNAYDNANRHVKVFDPIGNIVQTEYDANGNTTATIDKLGRRWTKTYDRLNRVIAESDPLGNAQQTVYDAAGRVQKITTPNGYPSTHIYDGRGRLTKWLDAEGFNWLYNYDGSGNIVDIEDALHGHYVMGYGNRNERTLEKNQDNFQWTYQYDELLRPKQQTDPNGTIRTITYDAGGRIQQVDLSTSRQDIYQYDANNNLLQLTRTKPATPTTSSTFSYDTNDRITQSTDTFSQSVKYTYDVLGRVQTLTYPDNKVLTQSYDALSRLTNQVDWAGRNMWYTYDKANRLTRRTYPNGITQTNAFDSAGRLTDLQYRTSSNSVYLALSYAYDRNGNKTSATEKGTLDWLQPAMHNETAGYTAAGHLVGKTDAGVTSNNWTYAYDASGNMTNAVGAGQSFAFTYDEDNRVLALGWAAGSGSTNVQNRYDALGRRISRTANGVETRYALDLRGGMERILCDMNASGQITGCYIHGPDLCYKVTPGTTETITCYHADAQANIIALTDAGGTNIAQYAYTPYGRLLGSSQPSTLNPQPFLFVGSQGVMEELPGLYFMRARYYSADTGVFLSTDPVKKIGPGWEPSAYEYAGGNPLSHLDPNGAEYDLLPRYTCGDGNEYGLENATITLYAELQGVHVRHACGGVHDKIWGLADTISSPGKALLVRHLGDIALGVTIIEDNWYNPNAYKIAILYPTVTAGVAESKYWGPKIGQLGDAISGLIRGNVNRSPSLSSSPPLCNALASGCGSFGTSSSSPPGSSSLANKTVTTAVPTAFVANAHQAAQPAPASVCVATTASSTASTQSKGNSGSTAFTQVVNTVQKAAVVAANNVSIVVKSVVNTVTTSISKAVSSIGSFIGSIFGGKH